MHVHCNVNNMCVYSRTGEVTFPCSELLSAGLMWLITTDPEGSTGASPVSIYIVAHSEFDSTYLYSTCRSSIWFGTHLQGKYSSKHVI